MSCGVVRCSCPPQLDARPAPRLARAGHPRSAMQAAQQQELEAMTDMFNKCALTLSALQRVSSSLSRSPVSRQDDRAVLPQVRPAVQGGEPERRRGYLRRPVRAQIHGGSWKGAGDTRQAGASGATTSGHVAAARLRSPLAPRRESAPGVLSTRTARSVASGRRPLVTTRASLVRVA